MSDLLNQASLVMVPSGYKEDTVYSVVPTDGSGDLSFTRASNGTRVNSAGLVEVVPWNLLEYSEQFENVTWGKVNATITANTTVAPNGTTTADTLAITSGGYLLQQPYLAISIGFSVTISIYAKTQTNNFLTFGGATPAGTDVYTIQDVGNGWYRHINTRTFTASGTSLQFIIYDQVGTNYIWGAQLNIGSTAKPYFPTTDRLNAPRLTYQNGGGGCPSLLLEKQSTNYALSSEDFSNTTYWTASGSMTVTANQTTSPDGTQNADLFYNSGAVYKFVTAPVSSYYSFSCYFKRVDVTTVKITASDFYSGDVEGSFNLVALTSSSAITGDWSNNTTKIESVGNGWYRCTVTALRGSGGSGVAYRVECAESAKSFYAWGYQAEASSYPTSYIPTTSSSATRVADACVKNGIGSLIGGTSGTVFFDVTTNPVLSSANYKQFCYYFDSASAQSYMYLDGSNLLRTNANWGSLASSALQPNTRYKVALVYAPNDFALYVNGVSVATASSGTPKDNVNISIGQITGTENCEFVFNQYTHFKTRLTNAELASLTTL